MVSELRRLVEQLGKSGTGEFAEELHPLLSAQVARLEKDAEDFEKARADLREQKAKAERTVASVQEEKQALARKLEDLDAELSETLVESARRTTTQRKAIEDLTQRAARLERELAARSGNRAGLGPEEGASSAAFSRRVVELEQENETLTRRLAEVEGGLSQALADKTAHQERQTQLTEELSRARAAAAEATGREGAQRLAMEAASQRAAQLEKEAAALVEREAKLSLEWEASRSEWSERLRQAESLRSERQTLVTLMVGAERARDRALAEVARLGEAHRAELDEQRQLTERLKSEAAAATQREARQAEAWQAARAEMAAKIARLEADAGATPTPPLGLLNP